MITNEENIKKIEKNEQENPIMTFSKNYYMLFGAITGLKSTTEVDFGKITEEFILYLNELVGSLDERIKKVLELRFGLIDGISRTLEDVGKVFGVTRERIRQAEAKALRGLRNSFLTSELGSSIIEEAKKSGITFEDSVLSNYVNKSSLENNSVKPQL